MPATFPEPGQIVIVRQRPFVVSDIQTSTLPPSSAVQQPSARQHLLRLSSVEDEGLGEELSIVWELLIRIRFFDAPRKINNLARFDFAASTAPNGPRVSKALAPSPQPPQTVPSWTSPKAKLPFQGASKSEIPEMR